MRLDFFGNRRMYGLLVQISFQESAFCGESKPNDDLQWAAGKSAVSMSSNLRLSLLSQGAAITLAFLDVSELCDLALWFILRRAPAKCFRNYAGFRHGTTRSTVSRTNRVWSGSPSPTPTYSRHPMNRSSGREVSVPTGSNENTATVVIQIRPATADVQTESLDRVPLDRNPDVCSAYF